jgi:hypothetical protein
LLGEHKLAGNVTERATAHSGVAPLREDGSEIPNEEE